MDLFHVGNHGYLACTDRLTNWLILYHLIHGQANASKLIRFAETYFKPTVPPRNQAMMVFCLSHPSHLHSLSASGWVDLAIKSGKRIVNGNTGDQESLDNDHVARAILQNRNTPIQNIELPLARMQHHCRLHDVIPSQPTFYKPHANWIAAALNREMSLSCRNAHLTER